MSAERKTTSGTRGRKGGVAMARDQKRRSPGDKAARAKGRRKTAGGAAKKRKGGSSARVAKLAELTVELGIRVADGTYPESKNVKIAGIVRPSRRAAPIGFPGVQDREKLAKRVSRGIRTDRLARMLAAIAHPQRLAILLKLLASEANHKLLTKTTGLKAGPLYYHLRELREAGLIGPRTRDLYVMTRLGRRVILAAIATEQLCR